MRDVRSWSLCGRSWKQRLRAVCNRVSAWVFALRWVFRIYSSVLTGARIHTTGHQIVIRVLWAVTHLTKVRPLAKLAVLVPRE